MTEVACSSMNVVNAADRRLLVARMLRHATMMFLPAAMMVLVIILDALIREHVISMKSQPAMMDHAHTLVAPMQLHVTLMSWQVVIMVFVLIQVAMNLLLVISILLLDVMTAHASMLNCITIVKRIVLLIPIRMGFVTNWRSWAVRILMPATIMKLPPIRVYAHTPAARIPSPAIMTLWRVVTTVRV